VTYNVGDIGPGGGLVFLKSEGLTYEMAPKTWSGASEDPTIKWCDDANSNVTGALGTAIGNGAANTTAMIAACPSGGAGNSARAYTGGGFMDWFLPSLGELNAMYLYETSIVNTTDYGFAGANYWSSSQYTDPAVVPPVISFAWGQFFVNGSQATGGKDMMTVLVRPIRAF
jgi:hypothetical protein